MYENIGSWEKEKTINVLTTMLIIRESKTKKFAYSKRFGMQGSGAEKLTMEDIHRRHEIVKQLENENAEKADKHYFPKVLFRGLNLNKEQMMDGLKTALMRKASCRLAESREPESMTLKQLLSVDHMYDFFLENSSFKENLGYNISYECKVIDIAYELGKITSQCRQYTSLNDVLSEISYDELEKVDTDEMLEVLNALSDYGAETPHIMNSLFGTGKEEICEVAERNNQKIDQACYEIMTDKAAKMSGIYNASLLVKALGRKRYLEMKDEIKNKTLKNISMVDSTIVKECVYEDWDSVKELIQEVFRVIGARTTINIRPLELEEYLEWYTFESVDEVVKEMENREWEMYMFEVKIQEGYIPCEHLSCVAGGLMSDQAANDYDEYMSSMTSGEPLQLIHSNLGFMNEQFIKHLVSFAKMIRNSAARKRTWKSRNERKEYELKDSKGWKKI